MFWGWSQMNRGSRRNRSSMSTIKYTLNGCGVPSAQNNTQHIFDAGWLNECSKAAEEKGLENM